LARAIKRTTGGLGRKEVSIMRAYYVKLFRHLLSTTILAGFAMN
jgi:hypothetical protein